MDLADVFSSKCFLMLLPPRKGNPLSANARQVFSLLAQKRRYGKGLSLEKIGSHLGMAAHHGAKSAVVELQGHKLVNLGDAYEWHAAQDRPPIFAERGFIKLYLLKKRKHGSALSNLDNLTLWTLYHLQKTKWKWPRDRNAALAVMLGIDRHNVGRQIGRIEKTGLIDSDWRVHAQRIDPDLYRDQGHGESQKHEPIVLRPATGNPLWEEFLDKLDLHLDHRGFDHPTSVALTTGLASSGLLTAIKGYRDSDRYYNSIKRLKALDLDAILEVFREPAGTAPTVTGPWKAIPRSNSGEGSTDGPDVFGALDLESLANRDNDASSSDYWLDEFAQDEAVA